MQHPGFLWRPRHSLLRGLLQVSLLAVGALLVTYAVLFDQGRLTAGQGLFHEVFHDARHLLGIPCH
ncbi:MAG: CbtB-domain containing protein [Actinomycetota bacterium]|nr:CbtB-domain containing protein [Actinomycetota bacterium]